MLRPLPAPVDTVLELRALRTLFAFVTAAGTAGTGRARRAEDGLEGYSGGRVWDGWDGWERRVGVLFLRDVDDFGSMVIWMGWISRVFVFVFVRVRLIGMEVGSGGEAWISSADMATSNLRLSSIVPRLAAVPGRPSLAASSSVSSMMPFAML